MTKDVLKCKRNFKRSFALSGKFHPPEAPLPSKGRATGPQGCASPWDWLGGNPAASMMVGNTRDTRVQLYLWISSDHRLRKGTVPRCWSKEPFPSKPDPPLLWHRSQLELAVSGTPLAHPSLCAFAESCECLAFTLSILSANLHLPSNGLSYEGACLPPKPSRPRPDSSATRITSVLDISYQVMPFRVRLPELSPLTATAAIVGTARRVACVPTEMVARIHYVNSKGW